MPRVKYVKARKDYPQFGIEKGDHHYVWSMKMTYGGVTKRSKTPPRESQLTLSPYKGAAFAINESLSDDFVNVNLEEWELEDFAQRIVESLESAIEGAEELRDETQESLDAMPDGLQEGPTGELLQERIQALEDFISEADRMKDEAESFELSGDHDEDQDTLEDILEEAANVEIEVM